MHTPIRYSIVQSGRPNDPSYYGTQSSSLLETSDGDFTVSSDGQLTIAHANETAAQVIRSVLSTKMGEAKLFNSGPFKFGCQLRELIGKINSPAVRRDAEKTLLQDLLRNGISPMNSKVEILGLNEQKVLVSFAVLLSGRAIQQAYSLDVLSGSIEDIGGNQI